MLKINIYKAKLRDCIGQKIAGGLYKERFKKLNSENG